MGPFVVVRVGAINFAAPVIAKAHLHQLLFKLSGVIFYGLLGTDMVFYGVVFGRQTKGVPAHRVQHIKAAHPREPTHGIADRVVAHVSDVHGRATGIREIL